ncbi:MAG: TVP38/TMEM64 family protein [Planctomycetota bacterium]|nr:MAG: TVP38/TMEM64 family protein [Planctomycetota bacterium]
MKSLLLLLSLLAAAAAAALWLPLDRLPEFGAWIRGLGVAGALLIGALYAAATVLLIPGSLITLLIGAIYGPLLGLAIVSPASVAGATLAFLLGRGVFRPAVERKLAGRRRFDALQTAMARDGFKILTLVRLSPVFPFTLVNYAFGLTPITTGRYVLGSFLGMLPGTLMYVWLGSTAGDLAELTAGAPDAGAAGTALKAVGLLATILVTVLITRSARRALAESAPEVVAEETAR